jgi:uncharacterized protein (TIGR00255 family)
MIRSMTGFGRAEQAGAAGSVEVQARSLNNRYLKISVHGPEGFTPYEDRLERLARGHVSRGTLTLIIRCHGGGAAPVGQINQAALRQYHATLTALGTELGAAGVVSLGQLLALPGVVVEPEIHTMAAEAAAQIEQVAGEALAALVASRAAEGTRLAQGLQDGLAVIEVSLDGVATQAAQQSRLLADRLRCRLEALLADVPARLDQETLEREVAVLADRADLSEELARMRAHLAAFREELEGTPGSGRKLEFLVQEMQREANTMGSKSLSAEVTREVIVIKAEIEKLREQLQNVE